MRALLEPTLDRWGIQLDEAQYEQFAVYAQELVRWNEKVNLTAITSLEGIAVRHFLDSLGCIRAWQVPPASLIDVGTGAGFPGLVLKIAWPQLRLVLADSVGKKTAFLQHLVTVLELTEVEIITARAEALGHDARYREQFEGAVARAVAGLPTLCELCLPLLAVGGRFVAAKGTGIAGELVAGRRAAGRLGGTLRQVLPVELPGVEGHQLVIIDKTKGSPDEFPRAVGVPTKRPL
ncbi:MAG: 16S rRNA (guanine(527)-N(7))-methyltransferase RsmG [Herpetosiphon sp.]